MGLCLRDSKPRLQIGDPEVPPPLREGIDWKVNSYLSDGFFTRFQIEGDLRSLTFYSTDLLAKEDAPIVDD